MRWPREAFAINDTLGSSGRVERTKGKWHSRWKTPVLYHVPDVSTLIEG